MSAYRNTLEVAAQNESGPTTRGKHRQSAAELSTQPPPPALLLDCYHHLL